MLYSKYMKESLYRVIEKIPQSISVWGYSYLVWNVVLFCLSSLPLKVPEESFSPQFGLDKVLHVLFFMGGSICLTALLYYRFKQLNRPQVFLIGCVIGSIVGWLDEYHQSFNPGRMGCDVGDWIADCIGTVLGAAVILYFVIDERQN